MRCAIRGSIRVSLGARAFSVVSAGRNGLGGVGLASLTNCSRLWVVSPVPSCLVLALGCKGREIVV